MRRRGARSATSRLGAIVCLVASLLVIVPPTPAAAASDRLPDLRSAAIRVLYGEVMTYPASRRRRSAIVIGLMVVLLTLAGPLATARAATFSISLPLVTSHTFFQLTQVTNAGDATRLFVVERRGTVRVVDGGACSPASSWTSARSSGTAAVSRACWASPSTRIFETNHRLFVYYTRNGGDIVVARYSTNGAGTASATSTGPNILAIEHSAAPNHNGGAMAFGPDGLLYLGTGDGGGSNDQYRNGQSKTKNLLAKILRINVNGTGAGPYDRYASRRPIRSGARSRAATRSGPTACATRGGSHSTARPARCSSPMSARTATRRSTASRPATRVAATTAGACMEGKHCFRPHRVLARRATRSRSPNTPRFDQLLDHRRLRVPRDRPSPSSSARTSSPTSAAAGSGRCRPPGRRPGCAVTPPEHHVVRRGRGRRAVRCHAIGAAVPGEADLGSSRPDVQSGSDADLPGPRSDDAGPTGGPRRDAAVPDGVLREPVIGAHVTAGSPGPASMTPTTVSRRASASSRGRSCSRPAGRRRTTSP